MDNSLKLTALEQKQLESLLKQAGSRTISAVEKLRFYIKKNGKTGENFESVHKVSMAFVAKK